MITDVCCCDEHICGINVTIGVDLLRWSCAKEYGKLDCLEKMLCRRHDPSSCNSRNLLLSVRWTYKYLEHILHRLETVPKKGNICITISIYSYVMNILILLELHISLLMYLCCQTKMQCAFLSFIWPFLHLVCPMLSSLIVDPSAMETTRD